MCAAVGCHPTTRPRASVYFVITTLTYWRMQLAAARLRDTDAKVVEVALDVGYEGEAAFSRALTLVEQGAA